MRWYRRAKHATSHKCEVFRTMHSQVDTARNATRHALSLFFANVFAHFRAFFSYATVFCVFRLFVVCFRMFDVSEYTVPRSLF